MKKIFLLSMLLISNSAFSGVFSFTHSPKQIDIASISIERDKDRFKVFVNLVEKYASSPTSNKFSIAKTSFSEATAIRDEIENNNANIVMKSYGMGLMFLERITYPDELEKQDVIFYKK